MKAVIFCSYIRQSYFFSNLISGMWFGFLTVLSVKFVFFWGAVLGSLIGRYRFFEEMDEYFQLTQTIV
jgi:hypothetical protein